MEFGNVPFSDEGIANLLSMAKLIDAGLELQWIQIKKMQSMYIPKMIELLSLPVVKMDCTFMTQKTTK